MKWFVDRFAEGHCHPPASRPDPMVQCMYKMACDAFCSFPLFWRRSTVSPVFFGRYPWSSLQPLVLTPIISVCMKTACVSFAEGHRHLPASGPDLDGHCVYKMACGLFCRRTPPSSNLWSWPDGQCMYKMACGSVCSFRSSGAV